MTTVTERRIVREISEEEDIDLQQGKKASRKNVCEKNVASHGAETTINRPTNNHVTTDDSVECVARSEEVCCRKDEQDTQPGLPKKTTNDTEERDNENRLAVNQTSSDIKELSLVFKLGNSSLTGNSLKPNSAVRQLFPNPKFVSPPPAPLGKLISSGHALDEEQDTSAFLVTAENLRFLDVANRSKISDGQASHNDDSMNPIRRTIERNTLRRSLLDKYRTNSRKKGHPSKNLSLEERIRQLTCVDQEEEDVCQNSSKDVTDSFTSTEIDDELSIHAPLSTHEETGFGVSSTEAAYIHTHNSTGVDDMSTVAALPASIHAGASRYNATVP